MKLALVAHHVAPIRAPFAGGVESVTWYLARWLARRGHRVTMFAPPGSVVPGVEVRELELDAAFTDAATGDASMPPEAFMAAHHAYLRVLMELAGDAEGFDLVHSHSLHYLPVTLAPLLPMPVLLTLHTPPTPWLESALRARQGTAPVLAAVSRATAALWRSAADVPHVVANGVDTDAWPRGSGGERAVWCGRMVPEKAPHLAIDAARAAGMELRLAGPIADGAYWERAVAPRLGDDVRYVGHLGHAELSRLVGTSRVALMTPDWEEPFGMVAAEAMSTGTPVAAFARGGLAEVVGRPGGRLARPGDVAALAAAMREAASLSRDGVRAFARSRLGIDAMGHGYEALYGRVLDAREPVGALRPGMTIGWYVHHQGAGHRARLLAALGELPPVVAISSLPAPPGAACDWLELPLDLSLRPMDPTAGGTLHWAPLRHAGLRERMGRLAHWIRTARPAALVVDVSVEVALLARLHGIPTVLVAQRGRRDDPAHTLAYAQASAVVAPWTRATHLHGDGLDAESLRFVGAISRFDAEAIEPARRGGDVLVVIGAGGHAVTAEQVRSAAAAVPDRTWHLAGALRAAGAGIRDHGPRADVGALMRRCSVVVGSAGGNVVAEVAASRRPFVCLPQARPFDEQHRQAEALLRLAVAEIRETWPEAGAWPGVLAAAEERDPRRWAELHDGRGASRLAAVVREVAG